MVAPQAQHHGACKQSEVPNACSLADQCIPQWNSSTQPSWEAGVVVTSTGQHTLHACRRKATAPAESHVRDAITSALVGAAWPARLVRARCRPPPPGAAHYILCGSCGIRINVGGDKYDRYKFCSQSTCKEMLPAPPGLALHVSAGRQRQRLDVGWLEQAAAARCLAEIRSVTALTELHTYVKESSQRQEPRAQELYAHHRFPLTI